MQIFISIFFIKKIVLLKDRNGDRVIKILFGVTTWPISQTTLIISKRESYSATGMNEQHVY